MSKCTVEFRKGRLRRELASYAAEIAETWEAYRDEHIGEDDRKEYLRQYDALLGAYSVILDEFEDLLHKADDIGVFANASDVTELGQCCRKNKD